MYLYRKNIQATLLLAAILLFIPTFLMAAETANFDNLPEGAVGNEITNGNIRFFNLDNGLSAIDSIFVIENAEDSLSGESFSSPNGLSSTGFTPGPEVGYGPIKEMSITAGGEANAVSMELFTKGTYLGTPLDEDPQFKTKFVDNTITLEAIKDGTVVGSDSINIGDLASDEDHFTLSLNGTDFDTLKLVSSPNPQPLVIDNVTISTVTGSGGGDIDGNCVVDGRDLHALMNEFGRNNCGSTPCNADIDNDGDVDDADMQIFARDFGRPMDCN